MSEVFDLRRFVTVSMTVGPASGVLKEQPEESWKPRDVALTVLIDRCVRVCVRVARQGGVKMAAVCRSRRALGCSCYDTACSRLAAALWLTLSSQSSCLLALSAFMLWTDLFFILCVHLCCPGPRHACHLASVRL